MEKNIMKKHNIYNFLMIPYIYIYNFNFYNIHIHIVNVINCIFSYYIFFDCYNNCLFELNNISLRQFYHKKIREIRWSS